jgi:hypothetical protein
MRNAFNRSHMLHDQICWSIPRICTYDMNHHNLHRGLQAFNDTNIRGYLFRFNAHREEICKSERDSGAMNGAYMMR